MRRGRKILKWRDLALELEAQGRGSVALEAKLLIIRNIHLRTCSRPESPYDTLSAAGLVPGKSKRFMEPRSPLGVICTGGNLDAPEADLEKRAFYQELSDEDLMDHVVTGSEIAFATIVDRYKNRLQNVIYRYIRDFQRSEDLAQEAFVRVYLHRERYRKTGKFSTWIFTIAVNLAKNEIRRKVRLRNVLSLEHLTEIMGSPESLIKDENQTPTDRKVEMGQTSEVVAKAIAKLPEVYREALILRDIEGLTYEEIAEILDIPGGTVRSRINRARLMLKDKLKGFARTEL